MLAQVSYEEHRVTVKHYGTLPGNSPLLVEVPGVDGRPCRLHKLAAAAMAEMAKALKADLGIELELVSAWRPHRWKSWDDYVKTLTAQYGSLQAGRKWMAYNSPHETGLAMDIGVGGLWPSSKTSKAQRDTPIHTWLIGNAYRYGWHPYKVEPWHWEHPLSLSEYKSGTLDDHDVVEDDFD